MKTQATDQRPTGTCPEKSLALDASTGFGSDASKATLGSLWRPILRMLVRCGYTASHPQNVYFVEERRWLAWLPKGILRYLQPIQHPASNLETDQLRPIIATDS